MTLLRCIVLAVIFAFLSAPMHAQAAPSPQENHDQLRTLSRSELDVIKVLTMQERAWNKGDLEGFATGYKNSPETLFIGHQVSRGYSNMLADYRGNYPTREAMGTLGFSELEPRMLDEHFAVVIGKYHLERTKKAGGNADGLFSLIFEKTDAGWKIIVDHTT